MVQRTGEAETITTHYLFALGAYRALYIPNWIYRYFTDNGKIDPIAVLAGVIQTILYSDFFYIYYTKYESSPPPSYPSTPLPLYPSTPPPLGTYRLHCPRIRGPADHRPIDRLSFWNKTNGPCSRNEQGV